MNKKELIERIEGLKNLFGNKAEYIEIDAVIELISELDEPEKVKVPQFVADWIEESKKHCKNVVEFFKYKYPNVEMIKWIESEKRFDLIARAWLDGYEKEKRYLVRIIGITNYNSYLNYHKEEDKWTIESRVEIDAIRTEHTRKQLEEAGFGWVFNCEGIEIEEVE